MNEQTQYTIDGETGDARFHYNVWLTFSGTTCEVHNEDETVTVSKTAGMKHLREMRKYAKEFGLTVCETRWTEEG